MKGRDKHHLRRTLMNILQKAISPEDAKRKIITLNEQPGFNHRLVGSPSATFEGWQRSCRARFASDGSETTIRIFLIEGATLPRDINTQEEPAVRVALERLKKHVDDGNAHGDWFDRNRLAEHIQNNTDPQEQAPQSIINRAEANWLVDVYREREPHLVRIVPWGRDWLDV